MSKINNKLILILGILTFIFGLSLALPAFARGGVVESGVNFNPYTYPLDYISGPTSTVIPGCEGRNTGFSTTTSQSCVGNYVNNTPTTIVKNTYTTVSKTTDTSKDVAPASDVNENYSGLAANALFGSNSFMPTGLIQWIFFTILILVIVFLWRYVHSSKEKYMSEPMKHA